VPLGCRWAARGSRVGDSPPEGRPRRRRRTDCLRRGPWGSPSARWRYTPSSHWRDAPSTSGGPSGTGLPPFWPGRISRRLGVGESCPRAKGGRFGRRPDPRRRSREGGPGALVPERSPRRRGWRPCGPGNAARTPSLAWRPMPGSRGTRTSTQFPQSLRAG
jgi:hypothetical protein